MTTREEVRQYRRNNIGYLAKAMVGNDEVKATDYAIAEKLYTRLTRYALANGKFDESETEFNVNNKDRRIKELALQGRYNAIKNDVERLSFGLVTLSPVSMYHVCFCDKKKADKTGAIHEIASPVFFEY